MARHNSEPHVCRRVSSSKHSRCYLLDVSRARHSSASSLSRRVIFCARPSVASRVEASARDTRSTAYIFTIAARSSTSMIQRVGPSCAAVASWTEASMGSTVTTRAASIEAMTSCTRVTSSRRAVTSMLSWDRSCGSKCWWSLSQTD
jgi:hypothetical protein